MNRCVWHDTAIDFERYDNDRIYIAIIGCVFVASSPYASSRFYGNMSGMFSVPLLTLITTRFHQVQVLLNSTRWTYGGVDEKSALDAWIDAIEQSKHFVYIENEVDNYSVW